MQHFFPIALVAAAAVLAAPQASAQFGKQTGLRINLETAIAGGGQGYLGCCRTVETSGLVRYWVTARAFPITVGNSHRLYELDTAGAFVAGYNQPVTYSTTVTATSNAWGIRDMAWDGGDLIYGGGELVGGTGSIFAFRLSTRSYDPAATVAVTAGAGLANVRALAYVAPTDTFYSSNFGGNMYPIPRTTGVVGAAVASGATSMYGAGYDLTNNRLLFLSQSGGLGPPALSATGMVIRDYDLDGAGAIGTNITCGDNTVPGAPAGGIAGGLDVYYDSSGRRMGVTLAQATADYLVEVDLTLNSGITCLSGGLRPAGHNMGGGNPASVNPTFRWDLFGAPAANGGSGILFMTGLAGPFTVPLPAPPFIPGCSLLINPGLLFFIGVTPVAGGTGSYPLPIPAGANGVEVWGQSFLVPPTFSNLTSTQRTTFVVRG